MRHFYCSRLHFTELRNNLYLSALTFQGQGILYTTVNLSYHYLPNSMIFPLFRHFTIMGRGEKRGTNSTSRLIAWSVIIQLLLSSLAQPLLSTEVCLQNVPLRDGRTKHNKLSKVLWKVAGYRQDAANKQDKNYIQNFSQLTSL